MKDTGGPAFPSTHPSYGREEGMTLRDWFAGQAMQGDWAVGNAEENLSEAATRYYKMADAMLKERSKE
jgi:hypothetical protein